MSELTATSHLILPGDGGSTNDSLYHTWPSLDKKDSETVSYRVR